MENNKKDLHRQNGDEINNNENKALTLRRKRIITVVSVIITIALIVWFTFLVTDAIRIAGGVKNVAAELSNRINEAGVLGILIALGIQVLQVIVSPIPGQVIEITMGICYGSVGGALLCLAGSAIGAAFIMMFVKKFGVKAVELFISTEQINNMKFINSEKKLERLAFILFVLPGTPKDPLIFFFGLTKMKTSTFVVIQTLARAPAMFATTLGGKFLAEQNYLGAIIIFAAMLVLAGVGMLFYNKIMAKMKERKEHKNTETSKLQKDK